ncbi:E3 ubiquitin-protein ligase SDIR1-like [Argentina anserina]|uniref:E3 ubiquitin-protein ligase SDIR1-like n=1 Tax=Argentina anserina TaxID=57926 RepID=UPI0021763849|nr:E3 ubiquitin-protein ligase SDIR1-like [Potentilla anserina]
MDINVEARKQALELAADVNVSEKSRSALAGELSRLHVPDQICDSMVDKIVADAFRTAKRTSSETNCMILHFVVDIFLHVVTVPYSVDPAFEPASKSTIEGLEKARVEVPTMCSVCLETMVVGLEAARMPCLHLYHGRCIVKWLGQSRFCPLCRYSMPIETLVNVT